MDEAKVRWASGQQFVATTSSGHTVVADGGPEYGGGETGPRPVELLLAALASCSGVAVMTILRRQRQPVTGLEITVRVDRANQWPREVVAAHLDYLVTGRDLNAGVVARAIHLSESKYCSVAGSLRAPINSTFQIVDGTTAPPGDAAPGRTVSSDAPDP